MSVATFTAELTASRILSHRDVNDHARGAYNPATQELKAAQVPATRQASDAPWSLPGVPEASRLREPGAAAAAGAGLRPPTGASAHQPWRCPLGGRPGPPGAPPAAAAAPAPPRAGRPSAGSSSRSDAPSRDVPGAGLAAPPSLSASDSEDEEAASSPLSASSAGASSPSSARTEARRHAAGRLPRCGGLAWRPRVMLQTPSDATSMALPVHANSSGALPCCSSHRLYAFTGGGGQVSTKRSHVTGTMGTRSMTGRQQGAEQPAAASGQAAGSRHAHGLAPEPDPPRTASAPSSSSSLAPATAASGWPARQRTYVRLLAHGASATGHAAPARVLQAALAHACCSCNVTRVPGESAATRALTPCALCNL